MNTRSDSILFRHAWSLLVFFGVCSGALLLSADLSTAMMSDERAAIVSKDCLDCHDSEAKKGRIDLEDLSYDLGSDVQVAGRYVPVLRLTFACLR